MANNFMVNVDSSFDVVAMAEELSQQYQAKGFKVRTLKMKNGVKIVFEKNRGGINMLLGLGQGITATCTIHGKDRDSLSVNFSDGDWTGKIIGCIVGWFLCFIPIITAIVGIIKQVDLPKEIENDIQMLLNDAE